MLTDIRSIAVLFDLTRPESRIMEHAAALARSHGAHLIGICGTTHVTEHLAGIYVLGSQAIADVIEQEARLRAGKIAEASHRLGKLSREYGIGTELRTVWLDSDVREIAPHSLHSDLVMLEHPCTHGMTGALSAKRLLDAGGAPILMVPEGWEGDTIGRRVVLAWNGSTEARHAIGDAMPFITSAEWVQVLVVDAAGNAPRHGEEPGADMAGLIARHGARVEVVQVESKGTGVADTIMSAASGAGADLLVIGAYSHARIVERLFGGVTETLLGKTSVPLLVSR